MSIISKTVSLALLIVLNLVPYCDRALLFQARGHKSEYTGIEAKKKLAEAKYRPINPPIDLLINPLTKPGHDTGEVTEDLDSAYC